jgi:PAS domain S-box
MVDEGRRTILLVEDEIEIAIAKKEELEKCGYAVIAVDEGPKALLILGKNVGIDLILLDIDLGAGIEGPKVAKKIQEKCMLPILFLVNPKENGKLEKSEKLTAYGYAAKDSGERELDAAIKMALRLHEAKRIIERFELDQKKLLDSIAERRRAEESLQNERLMLRTLIDNIPTPLYSKDLAFRKTLANMAEVHALGAETEAEVLGQDDFKFFPKEFAELFLIDDQLVMQTGKPVLEREGYIPVGKGEMRWVLSSKFPLRDKDGRVVGLVGICSDIHDRKIAEQRVEDLLAEKELILKEVHHRIKNNMNTIMSILSLQTATLRDPAAIMALRDAGNRVQSMMVLYDKLYQSVDYEKLSIAFFLPSLVDEILANYPSSGFVRVEKNIGDFILDAKRLQSLGIIVNEMLTNIMKHAFTGRVDGLITVAAACEDGHVRITIEDNGIGIPESSDLKDSTGFGLMLIENLTKQMNGTIRIERKTGTRFCLEFDL